LAEAPSRRFPLFFPLRGVPSVTFIGFLGGNPMSTVHFRHWRCRVIKALYAADRSLRLDLRDTEDGGPIATATVCLVAYGLTPPAEHCYIKDYSENAGMLDALVNARIVSFTGTNVSVGYAHAHLCRVLI
jgi:hypothetical protein